MKSESLSVDSVTAEAVRLTEQVKAGGCASKLPPGLLHSVLVRLPAQYDPNVLVGFDKADDAGVYRIAPNLAIVQTVDFFTPMVDDPYTYGQIAATNALSDVYAMGGKPVTALSLVCFPQDGDLEVLEKIMLGGLSKMREAGCTVVGGHSVRDVEMKFGYAVTGVIHPEEDVSAIPLLQGAMEAVRLGAIPAGLLSNRDFAQCMVSDVADASISDEMRALLYDPQTAGGLLLAVTPDHAEPLLTELMASGLPAARTGCVFARNPSTRAAPWIELTSSGPHDVRG